MDIQHLMIADHSGFKAFKISFSEGKIELIQNSGSSTEDNNIEAVYIVN